MVWVAAFRPFGAGWPDEARLVSSVEYDLRSALGDPPAVGQAQPVTEDPVVRPRSGLDDGFESVFALGRWPDQLRGPQAQHRLGPQPESRRGGMAGAERNDVACPAPRR